MVIYTVRTPNCLLHCLDPFAPVVDNKGHGNHHKREHTNHDAKHHGRADRRRTQRTSMTRHAHNTADVDVERGTLPSIEGNTARGKTASHTTADVDDERGLGLLRTTGKTT